MTDFGFDQLLDAIAQNYEVPRAYLASLARLRDPALTPEFADLEREFGQAFLEDLTEAERRQILAAVKSATPGTGSYSQLQQKLTDAGFDLVVRENNDPIIDPALFVGEQYQMWCDQTTAVCGNDAAFCGVTGGLLVVNGDQFLNRPDYIAQCNGPNTVCVNAGDLTPNESRAGYFLEMNSELIEYELPAPSVRWNYVFYVGGPITTWDDPPVFDRAEVPNEKRNILKTLILQFKPMHAWAGLNIDFI
jgi:hypothetical protein